MHISQRKVPFPTYNEYGEGARQLQTIAEAVDPFLVTQNTTIPAIRTRPAALVTRTSNTPTIAQDNFHIVTFNSTLKDNASLVVGGNPTTGTTAHPALWQVWGDAWMQVVAAETPSSPRLVELRASWTDPVTGRANTEIARWKGWSAGAPGTGGEVLMVETVFRTVAPTTFYLALLHSNAGGGMQGIANSMHLSAIRVGTIP